MGRERGKRTNRSSTPNHYGWDQKRPLSASCSLMSLTRGEHFTHQRPSGGRSAPERGCPHPPAAPPTPAALEPTLPRRFVSQLHTFPHFPGQNAPVGARPNNVTATRPAISSAQFSQRGFPFIQRRFRSASVDSRSSSADSVQPAQRPVQPAQRPVQPARPPAQPAQRPVQLAQRPGNFAIFPGIRRKSRESSPKP